MTGALCVIAVSAIALSRPSHFWEIKYMNNANLKNTEQSIVLDDIELRAYNPDKDFDTIKYWISDERTHALWCANRTEFPLERSSFDDLLEDVSVRCGDAPYVVTDENDKPIGFFCFSLNNDTNEGMLKFVMVDPDKRGIGLGKEMVCRAVRYAFDVTKADSVQLMVFTENNRAKKCYESVGFRERHTDPDAFRYMDESWGRCNMVIEKDQSFAVNDMSE